MMGWWACDLFSCSGTGTVYIQLGVFLQARTMANGLANARIDSGEMCIKNVHQNVHQNGASKTKTCITKAHVRWASSPLT